MVAAISALPFAVSAQTAASSPDNDANAPTNVSSEQMTGRPDRELFLERDVEVIRGGTTLNADRATYWIAEDEVEASGNVRMTRFGDRYTGDKLRYKMDAGEGYVDNPTYHIKANNGQGAANRIDFESEDRAFIHQGTYSTCEGPDPDWYLSANTMRLDKGRDVGTAGTTLIYFKGVPVIGTPYMSFPLSGERKSGVLPPSIGTSSRGGLEIMVPYYFNIAPNRDFTLSPRIIAKRGVQIGGEARYLGNTYAGETKFEYLGNDRETKTDRYFISTVHTQRLSPRASFRWNINAASDDNYPRDFSRDLATSTNRLLLRDLYFNYAGDFWNASARASNYQVLQDSLSRIGRPYDRLPQLTFTSARQDINGFDWTFNAEGTRFYNPDDYLDINNRRFVVNRITGERELLTPRNGDRYHVNSSISYPIIRPGYFITPKVTLNATSYDIRDSSSDINASYSRVLPTFSLNTGLVFEREANFLGEAMTQTIEPRLFYVKTPYRDQSMLPNFDSAEADLSFAQIFNENRFIGNDRISDANQLTAAIVSRFIEDNGEERLRLALGQRYYFEAPQVTLRPNQVPSDDKKSDILAAAALKLSDTLSTEGTLQYSATQKTISRANYGLTWRPAPKKVLNLTYRRDKPNELSQIDVSGQWPLSDRWYGVGRINYSLSDYALLNNNQKIKSGNKISEGLLGLEYKADCWIFRVVAQRLPTGTGESNTSLFFQLELSGLTRLGSDPMTAIRNNVPGYQLISQPSNVSGM
ncbi:LPS-assembly protein LptD [Oxalicibacterium flavum]|uniref:LPS-assembly protein LptD n=2 Tax=Oxalicibacterium flavum TaxID=179467 RepID=A0A8J2UNP7_9BURK|nr:LPS-assembly protein LptD [Oxalicibacterium flavum]